LTARIPGAKFRGGERIAMMDQPGSGHAPAPLWGPAMNSEIGIVRAPTGAAGECASPAVG
jgi:hypothetical protein